MPLSDGLHLQVLPSIDALPKCQRHHFGAFIRDQLILVVWDDQPKNILKRAEYIERALVEEIWSNPNGFEDTLLGETHRPTLLINAVIVGFTVASLIAVLGLGWRNLAQEILVDGRYIRLALLVVTPCQIFVSLVCRVCFIVFSC